jgi:hypothetical protein
LNAVFSLFQDCDSTLRSAILEAVRAAGKQGDLALAETDESVLRELGLKLIRTPGGTPNDVVNSLHWEARPSLGRRILLYLRRRSIQDWFNESVTPQLLRAARLCEGLT